MSGLRCGFSCGHRDRITARILTGSADRHAIKKPAEAGCASALQVVLQIAAGIEEISQRSADEFLPLLI
jgi:hypothetical protein